MGRHKGEPTALAINIRSSRSNERFQGDQGRAGKAIRWRADTSTTGCTLASASSVLPNFRSASVDALTSCAISARDDVGTRNHTAPSPFPSPPVAQRAGAAFERWGGGPAARASGKTEWPTHHSAARQIPWLVFSRCPGTHAGSFRTTIRLTCLPLRPTRTSVPSPRSHVSGLRCAGVVAPGDPQTQPSRIPERINPTSQAPKFGRGYDPGCYSAGMRASGAAVERRWTTPPRRT